MFKKGDEIASLWHGRRLKANFSTFSKGRSWKMNGFCISNFLQYGEDLASHAQAAPDLMQWQVSSMTHLCWHCQTQLPLATHPVSSLVILSPLSPASYTPVLLLNYSRNQRTHPFMWWVNGDMRICTVDTNWRTIIDSFSSIEQQGVCLLSEPSIPSSITLQWLLRCLTIYCSYQELQRTCPKEASVWCVIDTNIKITLYIV